MVPWPRIGLVGAGTVRQLVGRRGRARLGFSRPRIRDFRFRIQAHTQKPASTLVVWVYKPTCIYASLCQDKYQGKRSGRGIG
jgi:hypothetical protein